MKTELKLWKKYCEAIEKYNDKEQKRVIKVNIEISKNHKKYRDRMEKHYKVQHSSWERKHKYYMDKFKTWDNLPFWKKIFIPEPEIPFTYSRLCEPRDYTYLIGLPGFCLSFTKHPTYEGFLSWQIDNKI